MTRGVPNHDSFTRQSANLGPLSRRVHAQKKEEFSSLFLKESVAQAKAKADDAVFKVVGKVVDDGKNTKLGENPHVVDQFKYSRNSYQARQQMRQDSNAAKAKKASTTSYKQSSQTKSANRKFATLDNDPIHENAPAAQSMQEKISRLEKRVSQLEEQVVQDRFTSNPKVSFPESLAYSRNMRHSDANYQAHGKAYSSMVADLKSTTNRIALG